MSGRPTKMGTVTMALIEGTCVNFTQLAQK
jgi:hypothetical protein